MINATEASNQVQDFAQSQTKKKKDKVDIIFILPGFYAVDSQFLLLNITFRRM